MFSGGIFDGLWFNPRIAVTPPRMSKVESNITNIADNKMTDNTETEFVEPDWESLMPEWADVLKIDFIGDVSARGLVLDETSHTWVEKHAWVTSVPPKFYDCITWEYRRGQKPAKADATPSAMTPEQILKAQIIAQFLCEWSKQEKDSIHIKNADSGLLRIAGELVDAIIAEARKEK